MQMLRIVMLVVALALGYVLFFHSQTPRSDLREASQPATADGVQADLPQGTPRTQYKQAMDKAQAAAKAMQDERKEADSY